LDSNNTKDFLKNLFYLFFLKSVSKNINLYYFLKKYVELLFAKQLPPHNCRRTTAVAQHDLDSNNTKDFLKTLFYLFFKKCVKKH